MFHACICLLVAIPAPLAYILSGDELKTWREPIYVWEGGLVGPVGPHALPGEGAAVPSHRNHQGRVARVSGTLRFLPARPVTDIPFLEVMTSLGTFAYDVNMSRHTAPTKHISGSAFAHPSMSDGS